MKGKSITNADLARAYSQIFRPIGDEVESKGRRHERSSNSLGPLGAPLALWAFVISAVVCASLPTKIPYSDSVGDQARCFSVIRTGDRVVVRVPMGTPLRRLSVLLLLEPFSEDTPHAHAPLQLWSRRLVDSGSVHCSSSGRCDEVFLASSGGPTSGRALFRGEFDYWDAAYAEVLSHEAYNLGLDGLMRLQRNVSYTLTAGHLCAEPLTKPRRISSAALLQMNSSTSRFHVSASALQNDRTLGSTFASDACPQETSVEMFPAAAALESEWLFASKRDYERGHGAVEARRKVIEEASCAANASRVGDMLDFACSAQSKCREAPSVPFRRVADHFVRIEVGAGESSTLQTEHMSTLQWLPRLADEGEDPAGGGLRVLLLALTALVIFVRSATSPSAYVLFAQCCETLDEDFKELVRQQRVRTDEAEQWLEHTMRKLFGGESWMYGALSAFYGGSDGKMTVGELFEAAFLGLLALGTRAVVAAAKYGVMSDDGNRRVIVTELAISFVSFLAWAVRWLGTNTSQSRMTIFGGSTAITDASAAVLVSFMEPPLRAEGNTFAAIARLLTAVVIVFTSLVRVCFAASCCFTLASSASSESLADYKRWLYGLGLAWLLQAAALGLLVVDGFVTPAVESFAWRTEGDLWSLRVVGVLFFTCLMLPKLTYSSIKIAGRKTS